jgi:hypothetical protein
MTIILVLIALINGVPHQTKIPMETIEQCASESAKFLNYAMTDKHAQKAIAACQVDMPEKDS